MNAITVKFTEFPNPASLPAGVPHFHTPEAFKAYVTLYWSYRKFQNLDINITAGFAPFPDLPAVSLGQETLS